LALLVSPNRDGVAGPDPAAALREAELAAERDRQAQTIAELETRITELQAELTSARAVPAREPATPATVTAAATENARAADALATAAQAPSSAEAPGVQTIVVIDGVTDWERYPVRDHRVVVAAPAPGTTAQVRSESPSRIVVNVAAPGGARADRRPPRARCDRADHRRRCRARTESRRRARHRRRRHASADLGRVGRGGRARGSARRARVRGGARRRSLMKMRQLLAKQGLSVSMARDTKQIDELLAMVRPQVVVIDLELPMRQGYELVMRMAATTPVPAMVLMAPTGDPTRSFTTSCVTA
jgi:hypothetical protein